MTCKYFDQLHAIIGGKANVTPKHLVGNVPSRKHTPNEDTSDAVVPSSTTTPSQPVASEPEPKKRKYTSAIESSSKYLADMMNSWAEKEAEKEKERERDKNGGSFRET